MYRLLASLLFAMVYDLETRVCNVCSDRDGLSALKIVQRGGRGMGDRDCHNIHQLNEEGMGDRDCHNIHQLNEEVFGVTVCGRVGR